MPRESSTRAPSDQSCINVSTRIQRHSASFQKTDDKEKCHPKSSPRSIDTKKERALELVCRFGKGIHVIPLVVFICWFILWWFSHPLNVVKTDEGIVVVHGFMRLPLENNTEDNLPTMLSPTPSDRLAPQELNSSSEPPQPQK